MRPGKIPAALGQIRRRWILLDMSAVTQLWRRIGARFHVGIRTMEIANLADQLQGSVGLDNIVAPADVAGSARETEGIATSSGPVIGVAAT